MKIITEEQKIKNLSLAKDILSEIGADQTFDKRGNVKIINQHSLYHVYKLLRDINPIYAVEFYELVYNLKGFTPLYFSYYFYNFALNDFNTYGMNEIQGDNNDNALSYDDALRISRSFSNITIDDVRYIKECHKYETKNPGRNYQL